MLPELEISLLPPDHIKGHGRGGRLIPSMESKLDKKGNSANLCSVRTRLTREKIRYSRALASSTRGLRPRKGPESVHKQTGPVLCFFRCPLWEDQPQEFRNWAVGLGLPPRIEWDSERAGLICVSQFWWLSAFRKRFQRDAPFYHCVPKAWCSYVRWF